jgi:uncharacterized membrane protein
MQWRGFRLRKCFGGPPEPGGGWSAPPKYNVPVERLFAAILTLGALAWSAILFIAPYALTSGHPRLVAAAAGVYSGAGLICHQRAERSFHLAGVQQPVCARCAGLYVSGAAGALAAWIASRRPRAPRRTRMVLVLTAAPTVLTVVIEFVGLAHPSNIVRAVCALPLGAAAAWVFVRSLRAEAADPAPSGAYARGR